MKREGMSFCGVVVVVLIAFKLFGVIDWSWWWVTSPIWGGYLLLISFWLMIIVFGFVGSIFWGRK